MPCLKSWSSAMTSAMSSAMTYTLVPLLGTLITVDSKFSSDILLGIPVISLLFHLPYCSIELLLDSRLLIFSFNVIIAFSCLFLFCRFLIITLQGISQAGKKFCILNDLGNKTQLGVQGAQCALH